jgi:tetratricopeptide (TPR) repeat protein
MFSEQLRHQEATDVLFPIADRAQKDRLYQATLNRWRLSSKRIQSLYQYESGLALLEKKGNDSETLSEVKGKLQLAYRFYSDNIDILIRMYRLEDPNDPDWKSTVVKQIEQNIEKLEQDISRYESRKKMIPPDQYKEGVGEHYNQYAWLVSNTEGDYERALKYSLSSLEFLDSDDVDHRAARLDTCARCFFALGRVDEAIQTQKQAIILEPFSPPMNRQLKQFEAAL